MGDWASTRVAPGAKVYLFTGAAGNALEVLVDRATAGVTHRYTARPPLSADDLGVVLGPALETQAIVIRDIERATDADLTLILKALEPVKVPGHSLVLVGEQLVETDAARTLRAKISKSRTGVLVDVADPTGLAGRRHLIQWVAEEWQTTVVAATLACDRAGYRIGPLVWATRTFRAFSSGRPVEGSVATLLVKLAIPLSATEEAYRLLLGRKPEALAAVGGLDPGQTLGLLRRLESALTDMMSLYPVLSAGQSAKAAADHTGIHIARVLELAEWAPRYPPGVALRCRQALALGLEYYPHPEAAGTVAALWR